ncbi:ABC transporter substrate-binding protein [Campylobacter hepaticus]|uniref:ABC transporter substrate-binding protein n=1 Tax=Campylobacter hepaticus TaxID=1813019 RepID=A0A6A7JRZ7_9BACT|nr:ABC transporter substrate-binding protein [Campylobacter hepaticus]AXP09358.1 ABC transporter substrate-binding protein [Campylobacter hepaticus]MCZ0772898.1 ABC transporter substrate-binding protein [Campylobacter hepaticus]MCZ0774367.1 ABC transporter substrate-binding protein [Campylobacter hepaticus]MCZ0775619.1 ABC transporter substrate-binding protein [Campylobacter hepaticus]MDX2323596.1 ABC transporter substrate-binding protein [Campylobacter hepaticus]
MFRFLIFILLLLVNLEAKISKDTLIVAVENEISRINPAYSEDHDAYINLVFSGLTRFDENMDLKPDLAKSWNVSADGLIYDIFLRDDVLWHDKVKFSADDVKFSLDAFKNPKNNSSVYVNFEDIKNVEVLNPYHVKITLFKPYPALLDALSIGMLPKHLLDNKDLNTASFNQNPIGTGPYEFVKWKKGEYVEFKANENFYLAKVKTPRLIIKHIFDPSIASVELKNGKIDAALIDVSLLNIFKNDTHFTILREKSADYRALMFNLDNEFLKDLKIRQALNYAVDRYSIVKNLLHGYGFVANHPLENSWANPKSFRTYGYNPKKSEALLINSGFKKNKDGIFEKNGKILEFEIWVMSNDPLRVSLAGILQSEFKKIGVLTKVIAKPAGSFDYSKVDSFLVGWGSPLDPDFHTFRVFESSQDSALNDEGWNFGHYHDKKVDIALQKARNTLNLDERKKYYKEFIDALYKNPPFIFLTYLDFALVYNSEIQGIKARTLGHHGVGFTWNIYEWVK